MRFLEHVTMWWTRGGEDGTVGTEVADAVFLWSEMSLVWVGVVSKGWLLRNGKDEYLGPWDVELELEEFVGFGRSCECLRDESCRWLWSGYTFCGWADTKIGRFNAPLEASWRVVHATRAACEDCWYDADIRETLQNLWGSGIFGGIDLWGTAITMKLKERVYSNSVFLCCNCFLDF
jgi:hypothetical protein